MTVSPSISDVFLTCVPPHKHGVPPKFTLRSPTTDHGTDISKWRTLVLIDSLSLSFIHSWPLSFVVTCTGIDSCRRWSKSKFCYTPTDQQANGLQTNVWWRLTCIRRAASELSWAITSSLFSVATLPIYSAWQRRWVNTWRDRQNQVLIKNTWQSIIFLITSMHTLTNIWAIRKVVTLCRCIIWVFKKTINVNLTIESTSNFLTLYITLK